MIWNLNNLFAPVNFTRNRYNQSKRVRSEIAYSVTPSYDNFKNIIKTHYVRLI